MSNARDLADLLPIQSSDIKSALNASGAAPIYACRAWVSFNGTQITNPASMTGVRGSGNVSSILDNGGNGDYIITFATAMPDTNYSCVIGHNTNDTAGAGRQVYVNSQATGNIQIIAKLDESAAGVDLSIINLAIFR